MYKKRCILFVTIIIYLIYFIPIQTYASEIDISADSAIVIEQNTGKVLFGKNINEKKPMASTTKIMTAIIAIENGDLQEMVKISRDASIIEGSSIWLEENEELSLEELLYGLMLSSGNDAAYAIGEHIGGNIENFIHMMNDKAREIGALNTSFANPHGLDHEDHYTTAYDLAKIASYAMGNDEFRKIVSTKKKSISWPNHEWNRSLRNKNKMLWNYEGGNGVKTGYTSKAGKCLVAAAYRNEMQLISVVLNSNDIWKDSTTMLDYGFDNYNPLLVVKEGEYLRSLPVKDGIKKRVGIYSKEKISIPLKESDKENLKVQLHIPDQIIAPVKVGQVIGQFEVYIGNDKIHSTDIYVKESIERKDMVNMFKKFMEQWIDKK